jgi:sugar (pentulose or hexulose) kinase
MSKINSPYIIGIDIGTGSAKAIAMTSKGSIIADSQFFYPTEIFNLDIQNKILK